MFSYTLPNGGDSPYFVGIEANAGYEFGTVKFEHPDGGWITYDDLTVRAATDPTVVPEPATVLLLATGLGIIGVGALRRRRMDLLSGG